MPDQPLYQVIADHYAEQITNGQIADGAQLPSVRYLADRWNTSHSTIQSAMGLLKTRELVHTGPDGTFATPGREVHGPQQWVHGVLWPHGDRMEIRAAERVPAPEYILPIFGLESGTEIIRREWRTFAQELPYMLSVSWCRPEHADIVPELLDLWPLPEPGIAAKIIAERTDRDITGGEGSLESRRVKADGRERPLLYPDERTGHVLAVVATWTAGENDAATVLEYSEHAIIENKVLKFSLLP